MMNFINMINGKGALTYLEETGIITKVNNVTTPSCPLSINIIPNQFKIYPTDIGILISMLEDGTTNAIMSNKLGIGKGMIYEALVAEALYKRGGSIFYFAKETGLKLDFVINLSGESMILEVKAQDGNSKSAKTVLKHPEHYGKANLILIKDKNIGYKDGVLTIPHYMAHLLFKWSSTLPIK